MALPRSTSKPTILPPSLNSFGSYVGSVPTTSLLSEAIFDSTCWASASSFCTWSRLKVAAPGDGVGAPPVSTFSAQLARVSAAAAQPLAPPYYRSTGGCPQRDEQRGPSFPPLRGSDLALPEHGHTALADVV